MKISRACRIGWSILIAFACSHTALAHRFEPGLAEVSVEQDGATVFFRAPVVAPQLSLELPPHCTPSVVTAEMRVAHVSCDGAFAGELGISRMDTRDVEVVVQVRGENPQTRILTPAHSSFVVAEAGGGEGRLDAMMSAVKVGFPHVLGGWDHILFLVGLSWLLRRPRALVIAATAFTVGHSLSLALVTLGWVSPASGPIEALIALSVALLGVELSMRRTTLLQRHPSVLCLFIGVVHGVGFAEAFLEFGGPSARLLESLFGFNVGVELAQLLVLTVTAPMAMFFSRRHEHWRYAPAGLLTVVGVVWTLERISEMWA